MKKILFFLCLTIYGWAYAQKPFKMTGVIEGNTDVKEVKIIPGKEDSFDEMNPEVTVEVKKGKFQYSTQINKVTESVVMYGEGEDARYYQVFFVPGEDLKLTLKDHEYFYGGSKLYQACDAADHALTPLLQDVQDYVRKANTYIAQLPEDQQEAAVTKANDTVQVKYKAYNDAIEQYAKEHINDEGAMLYLSKYVDNAGEYAKMSEEMKNGRVGVFYKRLMDYAVKTREEAAKRAEEEQAKLDAMKGQPAKDFTLNDLNGNPLSLSSLKGKYVILDFWGSWCGWCIKGIPDMKKYYEKYAGKFEILGVDCNDSEKAWKDAVAKYELPWLHVYNPRESTVLADYNIQGFPTKIIIDPEGNLNKVIVGEDPAFYQYLDELLGK